ncbi:E3 ubiquitin-protein ligase NEURL1 isoform X5 [Ambystoma mexicanum]|uniref:E3 ubiquitin-protein ligase NEURL1 isoform X5 n=1 Tax=Ambystoma mexicanum TaxID=8296 RepID=UPI0037E9C36B
MDLQQVSGPKVARCEHVRGGVKEQTGSNPGGRGKGSRTGKLSRDSGDFGISETEALIIPALLCFAFETMGCSSSIPIFPGGMLSKLGRLQQRVLAVTSVSHSAAILPSWEQQNHHLSNEQFDVTPTLLSRADSDGYFSLRTLQFNPRRSDSIGGPFPTSTSHRCHHKQKHCIPISQCNSLLLSPLLFHAHAKGAQIIMDPTQKAVKRQASFCNAITFSNRPVVIYEQVRLKITKKQCCWSGALRLGFTSKDPSRINPDSLPKYACPDLVSQSGFWAKALPEEFANEGNIISFWVDKKGRVFYRINDSAAMLFFSGVRTTESLWALIDVYGLTRGVQLLGSTIVTAHRGPSTPSSPTFAPNSPLLIDSDGSETVLSASSSGLHRTSTNGTAPNSPVSMPESPMLPITRNWSDECTICYENLVDAVIYSCGHMCLCYTCGLKLKGMDNACCPICRRAIKDIIKTYRSS